MITNNRKHGDSPESRKCRHVAEGECDIPGHPSTSVRSIFPEFGIMESLAILCATRQPMRPSHQSAPLCRIMSAHKDGIRPGSPLTSSRRL